MKKLLLALALLVPTTAAAQRVLPPETTINCAYNSSLFTLSTGQMGRVQCDANGKLLTSGTVSITFPTIGAAVPATGIYNGINVAGTLRGWSGLSTGSIFPGTVAIVDASGNQVTSFGGSNASVSATGAAVPASGTYVGINIGGNLTGAVGGAGTAAGALRVELPTDGTGVIATVGAVTAITDPLPAGTNVIGHVITDTGSTTAVTQTTSPWVVGQASAAALNATVVGTGTFAVQATLAAETTKVIGTVNQGTSPWVVSAGSLPLPSGAATAANQVTEIASIDAVNTTLGSPFQAGGSIGNTTFAATQATAANLNATVVGNGTFAVQVAALALAQGSTTAAQTGPLIQGAVTTAAPSYTTAQTSPLSLNTAGALRVAITSGGGTGGTSSDFGAAFPTPGTAIGLESAGNMVSATGDGSGNLNVNCVVGCAGGTFNNNADNVATSSTNGQAAAWAYVWDGSAWDRLYGDSTNGAFVNVKTSVLPTGASTAAKQPALGTAGTASADVITVQGIAGMTKLLVTPDSIALPANQSVNVSQINGVTPLMGNGATGTGSPRVTIASDGTAISTAGYMSVKIDQTTPGTTNLVALAANQSVNLAQVGGTNTVNGGVAGSQSVGGTVATNVAITSNPLNLGAQAVSSENAAVTTARQVQLVADLVGKLIVMPYANPENFVSGVITSAMTGTTSTSLVAAPAAGLRNYLTACTFSNAHATVGTDIVIQDGSGGTTIWNVPAAAVYGGAHITFPTPLRQPTTATAIYVANVTTGASTKAACSGYKGA